MKLKYYVIILISIVTFLLACSQNPTESKVEPKPEPYIPTYIPGESIVLSYTWVDTSGEGDILYYDDGVTLAGRLDSIWFNFSEPCNQDMEFSIIAEFNPAANKSQSSAASALIYQGTIKAGKYIYGFDIDEGVDLVSTYQVQISYNKSFPLPLTAYLRLEY